MTKSAKRVWEHRLSASPLAADSELLKIAKYVPLTFLYSATQSPRRGTSYGLGLTLANAKRLAKELKGAEKLQAKASALEAKLQERLTPMSDLRVKIALLEKKLEVVTRDHDFAVKNIGTLQRNFEDPKLLYESNRQRTSASHGLARVVDESTVGKAMPGGLPSLGKRR